MINLNNHLDFETFEHLFRKLEIQHLGNFLENAFKFKSLYTKSVS